jgi:hypothetical protein
MIPPPSFIFNGGSYLHFFLCLFLVVSCATNTLRGRDTEHRRKMISCIGLACTLGSGRDLLEYEKFIIHIKQKRQLKQVDIPELIGLGQIPMEERQSYVV